MAHHDRDMQYKVRARWCGPFTVTRVNMGAHGTPASFKLSLPPRWHIHETFAAHQLARWNPAQPDIVHSTKPRNLRLHNFC